MYVRDDTVQNTEIQYAELREVFKVRYCAVLTSFPLCLSFIIDVYLWLIYVPWYISRTWGDLVKRHEDVPLLDNIPHLCVL